MARSPFAAALVAVLLTAMIAGCDDSKSSDNSSSDSSDSAKSSSPWPPQIGSQYVTGKPSSPVICSTADNALNQAMDALVKNDRDGAEQALDGTLTTVGSGTKILVLNFDILKGVLDMRIRSGDAEGSRVYCVVGTEDTGFLAKEIATDSPGN